MKIDVEGAELKVLEGTTKSIDQSKRIILCELHGTDTARQVLGFLLQLGYQYEQVEFISETRQHVLAFAPEEADRCRAIILHTGWRAKCVPCAFSRCWRREPRADFPNVKSGCATCMNRGWIGDTRSSCWRAMRVCVAYDIIRPRHPDRIARVA